MKLIHSLMIWCNSCRLKAAETSVLQLTAGVKVQLIQPRQLAAGDPDMNKNNLDGWMSRKDQSAAMAVHIGNK
jgi:hypothetical protein